jgi:carboxyl-terminal processing protease
MRAIIKGFVSASLVSAAFFSGFTFDALRDAPRNPTATRYALETVPSNTLARFFRGGEARATVPDMPPAEVYEATLRVLREQYFPGSGATGADAEKLGITRLTYAAIDGMLQPINDPYTEFYTPKEYKAMLEDQSGNFVGIGARLDLTKDKRVLITEPMEGSPAEKAGLLPGDVIVAVDGKSVVGQPMDAVIGKIRGDEGTEVRLTVERKGKTQTFKIKRAMVQSPIVDWRMEDEAAKIGYVRLTQFNEQADIQFDAALQRLEKRGMKALVFDLRDNPGGLLNVAQDLASRFVGNGPIVWIQERSGRMSSLNVEPEKHRGPLSKGAYPVIVLVNDGSASASEIVAGAIQDARAGTLVGERTYGKGLVQTIIPLGDDSAVKITTQHYFTRDKHDINRKRDADGRAIPGSGGIVPNYPVAFTDAQMEAQRDVVRANPQDKAAINRMDPQLQKALALARERLKK